MEGVRQYHLGNEALEGRTREDPLIVLRARQRAEYRKLCVELRLPETKAVLAALRPPDEETLSSASSGRHEYVFAQTFLGDRQFRPLAAALALDRQLVAISVPDTGLRDEGMVALCEEIKRSPGLEQLDVSHNRFSRPGAEACVSLARHVPKLRWVGTEDTCLDKDFCEKRGLGGAYASVRLALEALLEERQAHGR